MHDGAAVMKITKMQEITLQTMEARAKAAYGNYACPYCRKFVWWDEPHAHKEGAIVQTK